MLNAKANAKPDATFENVAKAAAQTIAYELDPDGRYGQCERCGRVEADIADDNVCGDCYAVDEEV